MRPPFRPLPSRCRTLHRFLLASTVAASTTTSVASAAAYSFPRAVAARAFVLPASGAVRSFVAAPPAAFAGIQSLRNVAEPRGRARPFDSSRFPAIVTMAAAYSDGGGSDDPGRGEGKANGLYLFDFDGVVCDSCDECTIAALRTVRSLGVLDDDDEAILGGESASKSMSSSPPGWLLEGMREIRPAIEVGWQIPVMLAVLLDMKKMDSDGAMTTEEVITNYESLVSSTLDRWGKTDKDMIEAFGGVRDQWMADDLGSWLEANSFYPGVPEGVSACRGEAAVVTTKQQRFAIALMRHAGVAETDLPDDDIYGLGMYKAKSDVIVERMREGGYHSEETHFFEDRWPTLAKCLRDDRLEGVRFYLCDWGYVAQHERELAEAEERVVILPLDRFRDVVA